MRFNKLTHLWIFFFTNDSVYSFQKVLTSHISEQPYYYKEIIDFLMGFRRRRLKARPRPQQGDTVGVGPYKYGTLWIQISIKPGLSKTRTGLACSDEMSSQFISM